MKTVAGAVTQSLDAEASPIVRLADAGDDADALHRARAFAEPLLTGQRLDTGEDALAHADGVAAILQGIGAAPSMRAAAYLVYAGDYLQRPEEVVSKAFGVSYAGLVSHTRKLVQIQRSARDAQVERFVHAAIRVRHGLPPAARTFSTAASSGFSVSDFLNPGVFESEWR